MKHYTVCRVFIRIVLLSTRLASTTTPYFTSTPYSATPTLTPYPYSTLPHSTPELTSLDLKETQHVNRGLAALAEVMNKLSSTTPKLTATQVGKVRV